MDAPRNPLPEGMIAQHHHLREMVASVRKAHSEGVDWDVLAKRLDAIIDVVHEHFTSEEKEMEAGKYPRLHEHSIAHQTFLRRLKVARAECERRETELMGLVTELLENWFLHHERTADAHVLEFLGLSPPKE